MFKSRVCKSRVVCLDVSLVSPRSANPPVIFASFPLFLYPHHVYNLKTTVTSAQEPNRPSFFNDSGVLNTAAVVVVVVAAAAVTTTPMLGLECQMENQGATAQGQAPVDGPSVHGTIKRRGRAARTKTTKESC